MMLTRGHVATIESAHGMEVLCEDETDLQIGRSADQYPSPEIRGPCLDASLAVEPLVDGADLLEAVDDMLVALPCKDRRCDSGEILEIHGRRIGSSDHVDV